MKKNRCKVQSLVSLLCVLMVTLLLLACPNTATPTTADAEDLFSENPVNITWKGDPSDGMESYQADIEVYAMNNRTDTHTTLQNKYRMSLKTINDVPHVRLDFAPEFNGGVYRSIMTNDSEMLVFDTNSGVIEYRLPVEDEVPQDLAFLGAELTLSRVNLSLIRSESKRLAFDIAETEGVALSINLPSHLFSDNPYETRLSTRATFDTVNETLNEMETVSVLDDGTTMTTHLYPIYEDKNGEPVKVGSVTVIDAKTLNLIEGFDTDTEIFETIDDIPTLSKAEADRLRSEGNLHEMPSITFGNPADLSYEETVIEVYSDVEINTVENSTFRLLIGGM